MHINDHIQKLRTEIENSEKSVGVKCGYYWALDDITKYIEETYEPLMTLSEVAKFLRISINTVTNIAKSDDNCLDAYRIGNRYRFKRQNVLDYLLEQEKK